MFMKRNGERFKIVTCFHAYVDVFMYTYLNIVALYSPYVCTVITFIPIYIYTTELLMCKKMWKHITFYMYLQDWFSKWFWIFVHEVEFSPLSRCSVKVCSLHYTYFLTFSLHFSHILAHDPHVKPHKDLNLFLTEAEDTILLWFIYKKCAPRSIFQTATQAFLLSIINRYYIFAVVYTHYKLITYVHSDPYWQNMLRYWIIHWSDLSYKDHPKWSGLFHFVLISVRSYENLKL